MNTRDESQPLWDNEQEEKRVRENFDELFSLLSKNHRGAGGGAFCICGAGGGGAKPCSALKTLKSVMLHANDSKRQEFLEWLGWY